MMTPAHEWLAVPILALFVGCTQGRKTLMEDDRCRLVADELRIAGKTLSIAGLRVESKVAQGLDEVVVSFHDGTEPDAPKLLEVRIAGRGASAVSVIEHERRELPATKAVMMRVQASVGGQTVHFGRTVMARTA